MSDKIATRRRFFASAGAALCAPAVFAATSQPQTPKVSRLQSRVVELEDLNQLRQLSARFIRAVNAGDAKIPELRVAQIAARDFDQHAQVEFGAERARAMLRIPCEVILQAPIDAPNSVLVDMARLQGEGVLQREDSRVLELSCTRAASGWSITRVQLEDNV